ncbi:MAG: ABC transporter permease [Parasphingorhabdus sp.]|uniref:ABC transporter permease n=1 Tax=Parasphingorhabdus sp. TaxID=2709688 RepID=UPI0030030C4E
MLSTTFLLAFRAIRRHLLRSFLTLLGIMIGVLSVITMVTLGNGATEAIKTSISALGSDLLQVSPGQRSSPGGGSGAGEAPPLFKQADVNAIAEQIGGVTAVTGQVRTSGAAIRNAQNWTTTINGTTNNFFIARKWELAEGRNFSAEEEQAGKSVCVIGSTIVENLFQDADPVGQDFRIKGVSCQVIGVLEKRGQSGFGGDQDDTVIMPLKAVQRQMIGNQDINSIMIGLDPAYETSAVKESMVSLLRERRNLGPDEEDDFNVLDAKQISDTVSGTVGILTTLLGAVAAVSLLVGGIGIMNIMLVSVTERTREIGIRLAIGALGREVMMQFLVESIVLSSLGGLIGIFLALIVGIVAAPLMGLDFQFDIQINVISFLFSAIIGVVFGYFPARRAAKLNPIDALRSE